MRIGLFCWLPFVIAAHAQTAPGADFVARLNSDLLPLGSLRTGISQEQEAVVQRYKQDITQFERQRHMAMQPSDLVFVVPLRSFFSKEQGYQLSNALVGKDLSERKLTPLSQGILGMVESAVVCRNTGWRLQDSDEFRASAEQAFEALRALGVGSENARLVMELLFRKAIDVTRPVPQIIR